MPVRMYSSGALTNKFDRVGRKNRKKFPPALLESSFLSKRAEHDKLFLFYTLPTSLCRWGVTVERRFSVLEIQPDISTLLTKRKGLLERGGKGTASPGASDLTTVTLK